MEFLAWSAEETWSPGWRSKDVRRSQVEIEEMRVGSVSTGDNDLQNRSRDLHAKFTNSLLYVGILKEVCGCE